MKPRARRLPRQLLVFLGLLAAGTVLAAVRLPPLNEPASGVSLPGKFVWFDLATPAIENQKAFYSYVFGWSFVSPAPSDDQYALILASGRAIGGIFSHEPPGGEQDGAVWIALLSVPDTERAARAVEANDGRVELPPVRVPGRGHHALFRDPGGALFGVLRSDSGDPPDAEVAIGEILWVDLFARDPDGLAEFYSSLAPYESTVQTMAETIERTLLSAHGMPRAGIVPVDEEANRSAWVPYVRVADVSETLDKVLAGGGFAIVPPDERLLDGNVAVFVDPNGGVTGIVRWDYTEALQP